MKKRKRNDLRTKARAKAFAGQVDVKKEKNLTKAYMAVKSSMRPRRKKKV